MSICAGCLRRIKRVCSSKLTTGERQPIIQALVDEILATLPQKLEAAALGGHRFAVIYDRYRDPLFHEIYAAVSRYCAAERLTVLTAHRDAPGPNDSQNDLIIVSW